VDYAFGPDRHFVITSQCTPVRAHVTDVYTTVTFRVGRLGRLVRLVLEPVCRRIIRQDLEVLGRQTAQLRRFGGPSFTRLDTDLFAPHIQALWAGAARRVPVDPGSGPAREVRIRF
jgi:hypothetical protein